MRRSIVSRGSRYCGVGHGRGNARTRAGSAGGFSVTIVAHTVFGPAPSEFESSFSGCETGTVVDSGEPHFTPWGGRTWA